MRGDVGAAGREDFVAHATGIELRTRLGEQQASHVRFGAAAVDAEGVRRDVDAMLRLVREREHQRAGAACVAVEDDHAPRRVHILAAAGRTELQLPAIAPREPHLLPQRRRKGGQRVHVHFQHDAAEGRDDARDRTAPRRIGECLVERRMRELDTTGRDPVMDLRGDLVDSPQYAAVRIGVGHDFAGIVQHHVAVAAEQHLEVVQQVVRLCDAANPSEVGQTRARYDARQADVEFHVDAADLRGRFQYDADAVRDRERPVGGAGRQLVDVAQHREPALLEIDRFVRVGESVGRAVAEHADRLSGAAVEHGLVGARAQHRPEEIRRIGTPCGIAVEVEIAVHRVDRQLAERRLAIRGRRIAVHSGQVARHAVGADRVRMGGVDRALPQVRELGGRALVRVPRRQDRRIARVGRRWIEQRERVRIDRLPVGAEQRAVVQRLGGHDGEPRGRVDQHAAVAQERQRVELWRAAGAERRRVALGVGLRPRGALRLDVAHRVRPVVRVAARGAGLRRRHGARTACPAAVVRVAVERRVGLAAGARYRRIGERIGEPRDGAGVAARRLPCVGFALQRVRQPHVRGDIGAAGQRNFVARFECVELRACFGFERRARETAAAAVVEPERALDRVDRMHRFMRENVGHRSRAGRRAVDRHASALRIDPAAAATLADAHAPAVRIEHAQLGRERAGLLCERADFVGQRRAADTHPHARDHGWLLRERVGWRRFFALRLQEFRGIQFDPAHHAVLDFREPRQRQHVRRVVMPDAAGIADQEVARAREDALQVEADVGLFEHLAQLHDVRDPRARNDGRQLVGRERVAVEHAKRADQCGDDAAERAKRPVQLHGAYAQSLELLERVLFVGHELLVGRAPRVDRRGRLRVLRRCRAMIDRGEHRVVAEREPGLAGACAEQFADVVLDVDPRARVAVEMNALGVGRQFAEGMRCRGRRVEAVEHARVEHCGVVADGPLGRRVDGPPPHVREPRGGCVAAVLRGQHDRVGVLDHAPRRHGERVFMRADRLAVGEQRAVGQRVGVQHEHVAVRQRRHVTVAVRVQFGGVGRRASVAER
ncbi:hypothetical protein BamIOP4010DRAFT_6519 [Burkholderia ambifaria IOP40-10]|uniref:Uncharacterized protein n=1 Tax=Burkholderia ambifaria IOP40-10 TaxID=396596 RepID=B1FR58_9BURK|nr:hypothetical protein BamIOP4010DRAFT_6519 [Burkholderia ambifaria IOP40-10]